MESSQLMSDPIYVRVRDKIREEIIKGVFHSGQRLKIADLSIRYGISHMPIREALQHLQGEGIIVLEPNKGAVVREVDEKFISNLYDLRSAIEEMMLVKCLENISEKEIKTLKKIQKDFDKAAAKNNTEKCTDFNTDFHRLIYKIADNDEAFRILDQHWNFIKSLRTNYGFSENRLNVISEEHHEIIKELQNKDEKKARKIMRLHTGYAKQDLLKQFNKKHH